MSQLLSFKSSCNTEQHCMNTQITAVQMTIQLKVAMINHSPVGTEVKQESVVLWDTFHLLCQPPGETIESEMAHSSIYFTT